MKWNWKAILGRIAVAIPPAAIVIFGIIGHTPKWWEGVLSFIMPAITWLISLIPDAPVEEP